MTTRAGITIDTSPVADAYSDRNSERRVEFSALRKDVLEDGSFNSLMGGLISFTVIRANGADVPEDKLIVHVYRTDPNVEVRWTPDGSSAHALTVMVTAPERASVVRAAVVHALDNPDNYPDGTDTADWSVRVV